MEIRDIKPKYRIGDTFRENGTRGYGWWRVDEIEIGVIEPIYTLSFRPIGNICITRSESALDENYHVTTISNL